MPSLTYGTGSYARDTGSLPPLECVNLFVEKARTSEGQVCLQSRPGLATTQTAGSGPIRQLYSNPGVLSGARFSASGSGASPVLYEGTTNRGTLTSTASSGSSFISMAGSASELLIAGQGTMYSWNGTNLTAPFTVGISSNNIRAVVFIGSLFCAVENNSARVYWSTPLDGRTWDSLDFFTAEREADSLKDIAALNDKVILYGQATVEVWAHTGDSDLPFTRIEGIGSQRIGIIDPGAWCEADNTVFHIGNDGVVYRLGEQFDRVSDHWLEEKIAASSSWVMFSFKYHGHEFVCIRLSSFTFAYDAATQEWCEFQSSSGQWIARNAAMVGTTAYFGNQTDGKVMEFSGWQDLGSSVTRMFTAAKQLDAPEIFDSIRLWCNVGQASSGSPTVTLEYSTNAGISYSTHSSVSLGASGEYRTRVEWRRCGQFDEPGAMFRISTSSNCPFRVSAVKYNDSLGGRSR